MSVSVCSLLLARSSGHVVGRIIFTNCCYARQHGRRPPNARARHACAHTDGAFTFQALLPPACHSSLHCFGWARCWLQPATPCSRRRAMRNMKSIATSKRRATKSGNSACSCRLAHARCTQQQISCPPAVTADPSGSTTHVCQPRSAPGRHSAVPPAGTLPSAPRWPQL